MALSRTSCTKARHVFQSLTFIRNVSPILRNEENQYATHCILGIDKKVDGGWESLFINVKDVTTEHLQLWENRKREISNSSSVREVQPGITRFGFY